MVYVTVNLNSINSTGNSRTVRKLRQQLPHSWGPFLGKFGNLTEVQARTIPHILEGESVAVSAPTASGKTEAIVAPVAEMHVTEKWPGLAVVYVAPTRALVNDLIARLQGPLSDMYLTAAHKHSDSPSLPKGDFHWLITTPESLDSLLCRRPTLFANLRTLILDEIHVLDGTYRGDQVRVLLKRLVRQTQTSSLTTHLLSATLPDAAVVAARYCDNCHIISVGSPRTVQTYLLASHEDVLQLAKANHWRKLLYFCNSRQKVEETAHELAEIWAPYPVVAHHGSLDRGNRIEAEEIMAQNRVAVCVATSTLEVGIDIGDVDLVVLADPPLSMETLLQRAGRGNRRSNLVHVAALFRTEDEHDQLAAMFDSITNPAYLLRRYRPDKSVVVQQILSLLYQHRAGIAQADVISIMEPLANGDEIRAIVYYLGERGMCLLADQLLFPTPQLIDLGDLGEIHSNIPDHGDLRVVDVDSGRAIGHIRGTFDRVFVLAGRSWQVVSVGKSDLSVRRCHTVGASATFGTQRNLGRYHSLLPPSMRAPDEQAD